MSKFSKCLWDNTEFNAMDSCYKLYTWINNALLMLLLQFLWKMSQISDYFKEKPKVKEETDSERTMILTPLTKESKLRRHIRSMSDVQNSTPYYRISHRPREGSNPTLMYDSDSRARRHHHLRRPEIQESSDSSDNFESARKMRGMDRNILKHTDSIRIL